MVRDFSVEKLILQQDLALPGARAGIELHLPRGDDKQRIVEIHGTNMDDDAAVGGRLLTLRDTTDRKSIEEQLRRLEIGRAHV